MGWPDRYRRQAHIALVQHEATGLPFFYGAAQTYLDLAREWEEALAERDKRSPGRNERKAEDSNPSA